MSGPIGSIDDKAVKKTRGDDAKGDTGSWANVSVD